MAGLRRAEPESGDCPFTDVPETSWYAKAVRWALETGRCSGTSAHSFSPGKRCTRAELAVFLYGVMMYSD